MNLLGLEFTTLKRKGKCQCCNEKLQSGTKTVIVGSFSNKYRYCIHCFGIWLKDNLHD